MSKEENIFTETEITEIEIEYDEFEYKSEDELSEEKCESWHSFNKSFFRIALLIIDSLFACALYVQEKKPKGIMFPGLMEKESYYAYYFNPMNEINDAMGLFIVGLILFMLVSYIFSYKNRRILKIYNFSLLLNAIFYGVYVAWSMYTMKYFAYIYILYIFLAVFCLFAFVVNLFYYNIHKDILEREKSQTISWLIIIVAVVLFGKWAIYCIGDMPFRHIKEEKTKYRSYMMNYNFDSIYVYLDNFDDGNDNLRYAIVQYVNYFGESGEKYTVEELKASKEALREAIDNSSQDVGIWYRFYQFMEDYSAIYFKYDFSAYNYWNNELKDENSNAMWYASCVDAFLREDGNSLDEADTSELEVACRKAYEFLSNAQVEIIEEVTFEIKQPKAGELMDFTAAYNSEEYVASFTSWVHGSTYYYEEDGKCFEDGRTYEANVIIHANIGYKFSDDVKINIEGIEYNRYDVNFSHSNNILYISIFENIN